MRRGVPYSAVYTLSAAAFLFLASITAAAQSPAGFVETNGIARDFTLKNRKTGQPVNLSDYAGKIIFLDLFAYW